MGDSYASSSHRVDAIGRHEAARWVFKRSTLRAAWTTPVWLVAVTASCAPAGHRRGAQEPASESASAAPEPAAAPAAGTDRSASKRPPGKTYTERERVRLNYCIGLSETARRAAAEKLRGTPIEDVKKWYVGKPNARLSVAAVDKVFKERVSTAWDYAVGFFGECAREIAGVSSDRVKLASYCMQNQLVADVAFQYKASGKSKEQAYAQFFQFKSSTPRAIVDQVYASTKEGAAVRMEVWNTCMAELSGA